MLNVVALSGRLVAIPELRRVGDDTAMAVFTLACERDFLSGGEKQVDFIDCVAWRKTAEFVSEHFDKGDFCTLSGRLSIRVYEDKNGERRRRAEVIVDRLYFGGGKTRRANDGAADGGSNTRGDQGDGRAEGFQIVETDELPF